MSWLALLLLALGAGALLWRLGVPRVMASFIGAAMMLGAAGYATQGRPGLPAHPARPVTGDGTADAAAGDLRQRMFGRFTRAEPALAAGDAMLRVGSKRAAVSLILGGVRADPQDAGAWTALGSAYVAHDGALSPAARFAFARARALAPDHPGPPFFLGLALLREGKLQEARGQWARALRLMPTGISYRAEIAGRLVLLDAVLRSEAGRGAP